MRVLGTLLEGSGKYFAVCILLGLLLTVVEMIAPQVIRVTVDSVIDSQPMDLPAWALRWVESLGGVAFLRANMSFIALILALAGLVAALLRYGANMFNAKAGETLVKTARDRLFHHIECLPWKWHAEHPTGDIIQRCTSDVERIKNFFQEQFISVFQIIVRIILALTLMTLMNAKLSIVAWVIAPIIVLYSVLFHNKIRARFTECDENEGVLSTIAQENLTGVRVVRAFGREKFERDRFEAQNNKYTECWISLTRTLSDFWAVGDFTSCLQILLVVVLGTVSCVNGNLTAGEFVSFSLYNTMLIGPVRRLGRIISEMSKAGVSIDRLGEVLEAETEQDAPNAAEAPMDKDIAFENVSFHYGEDGPDVLEQRQLHRTRRKELRYSRRHRLRQEQPAASALPSVRAHGGQDHRRRRGHCRYACALCARERRRSAAGAVPLLPLGAGEHRHLRRERRGDPCRRCHRLRGRGYHPFFAGLRHHGR